MSDDGLNRRHETGIAIAREVGGLALRHFRSFGSLAIEKKGRQDLVSEADREVELAIRSALAKACPDGLDRTSFCERKRRFRTRGFEGLKELPPIHRSHP